MRLYFKILQRVYSRPKSEEEAKTAVVTEILAFTTEVFDYFINLSKELLEIKEKLAVNIDASELESS